MPKRKTSAATYRLWVNSVDDRIMIDTPSMQIPCSASSSVHSIKLTALEQTIRMLTESPLCSSPVTLVCQLNDRNIEFEWNTEFREDRSFSVQTEDCDIWNRIVSLVQNNKIHLVIGRSESPLAGVCRLIGA